VQESPVVEELLVLVQPPAAQVQFEGGWGDNHSRLRMVLSNLESILYLFVQTRVITGN